jgi:hypothetical protein
LNVPVRPFIDERVSDVLPGCPGLAIVIDAGFATMEKSGPGFTVTLTAPKEVS